MSNSELEEWEEWEDENGKWKKNGNILLHVEPSQKWNDEHPTQEPDPPKPTEQEIINAQLIYESMIKDMKIAELETNHSDLMYLLMTTGVL